MFRDGTVFYGHWERPLLDHPAVFIDSKSGDTITLTPGNTWEELVPVRRKGHRHTLIPAPARDLLTVCGDLSKPGCALTRHSFGCRGRLGRLCAKTVRNRPRGSGVDRGYSGAIATA